ncbi:hypothetical protein ASD97_18400 [Streptomyces sp. Root63]|uniref:DUF1648 domain-containing protein n=1 Tax=Streptomyces TaxID=1883 RepID=UPI00067B3F7A|nr:MULTISPECIES: DUF1648 domain-containing protein [unclassified Streptomyces]KND29540.1 hypothetical protein IQ60_22255 [Streptomyces europaeiscabiei]WTC63179.1 DUF1648 domain-containing protein [Streptomyces anulatus]KQX35957.1 hypothetical protein ASD29_01350 [Streptomyces sp. Root1295]KRA39821.1 hypothetical protein ASD97_18400 [Streptomyces sp. Root63]WTC73790.1 DUF1648 domain-containing protein [Streptomyces anulatus]
MTSKNLGRATLAALPFVLALLVDLVLHLTVKDRLPARLAVHFDAGGSADGYMGITAHLLYTVTSLLVLGALWAFIAADGKLYGRAHRWFIGGGFAVAAFLGYLMIAVLFVNVDAPESGPDGGFPLRHIAVALGAAVLAGALGLLCSRLVPAVEDPRDADPANRERIALADGEVAGWARGIGVWWAPVAVLVLLATGVTVGLEVNWFIGAPLFVLALVVATFCRPHVTVDRRGLTVSGLLPRPRVRVPLERMAGADSRRVNALAEYGGWGYRIRPERSGVITRSGEAIVVSLSSGREFAVTVDDSATGAALLNTLLDRQRTGR